MCDFSLIEWKTVKKNLFEITKIREIKITLSYVVEVVQ